MGNLKTIRTRISSVQNTKKITKAMNMVSAAKLRKSERRLLDLRPYANGLSDLIARVNYHLEAEHPFFTERKEGKTLFVFISADKGLCGSFNSYIIRRARKLLTENPGAQCVLIGKNIRNYFKRFSINSLKAYTDVFNEVTFDSATDIGEYLADLYLNDTSIRNIVIVYNKFKNSVLSETTEEQFLPRNKQIEEPKTIYEVEPNVGALLTVLMKEYLKSEVLRILLESLTSEHGARMAAMDAATENADEMIRKLTLKANRERQSIITTEISEIVGGANAL